MTVQEMEAHFRQWWTFAQNEVQKNGHTTIVEVKASE